jgi:hypothetical protein
MLMSRIHGRSPRDWTLEVHRDDYSFRWSAGWPGPGAVRFTLSMRMTPDEANQLVDVMNHRPVAFHSPVSFGWAYDAGDILMQVHGLELTEDEARRIAHGHEDPLDVLAGPVPACGYRLRAVVTDLKGTG